MTVCGEKVTGVCVAGKCPYFKRCHPIVWDKYGRIKPQTNEEWFCSLDTEQKAEFMGDIWGRGYLTSHFEGNLEFGKKQDKAYWEMWLKEKHDA